MPFNFYETHTLLMAVQQLTPAATFLRDRYFPTNDASDVFATDDVLVEYRDGSKKLAPFVAPRKGGVTILRNGYHMERYAAGTITTLVDLIPYIESVTNLTETAGGDDGEPYTEAGDNRLRERIRLAPAKRSTAGPELAYIYWAMTADSSIIDVKAVSETETISRTLTVYNGHAFKGGATLLIDTLIVRAHGESAAAVKDVDYAIDYTDDLLTIEVKGSLAAAESIDIEITQTLEGCVKIVPLLKGGKTPDSAMLSKVLEAVNAKDTRPMTDKVRAVAPTTVPYGTRFL